MQLAITKDILNFVITHRTPLLAGAVPLLFVLPKLCHLLELTRTTRASLIPRTKERVVIIGATSGIGRSLALQYARRGASLCIVGRRESLVNDVVDECRRLTKGNVVGVTADFTDVEDIVRVRGVVEQELGGLDTLAVVAGVSALQPLMDVAQAPKCTGNNPDTISKATEEGIQRAKDVANAAINGNYIGPLVTAVTFIPLLQATSSSPSVLLISSPAAVIPAPTRSIYGSTKAASLLLYQALSIEHPRIRFTQILPSTVEGDFRAGAVDGGPVREKDPNKHGLKREDVARRSIRAVDEGEKTVFMPLTMRLGHLAYWLVPSAIEKFASRKYNFQD